MGQDADWRFLLNENGLLDGGNISTHFRVVILVVNIHGGISRVQNQ